MRFSLLFDSKPRLSVVAFFLGVLTFLAFFWQWHSFGLYEDDYAFIGAMMNRSWGEMLDTILRDTMELRQGRVIGFGFHNIVVWSVYHGLGFGALYIVGWLFVTLNAVLMYRMALLLFSRTQHSALWALIAAIWFVLYPADTAKALLIHIYTMHIGLTLSLCSLMAFLRGRQIVGFFFAFLTLFTYETCLLVLCVVPLLRQWQLVSLQTGDSLRSALRRFFSLDLLKRFLLHNVLLGSFILSSLIARKLVGESRVEELSAGSAVAKLLMSLVLGPIGIAGAHFHALGKTLANPSVSWVGFVLGSILVGVMMWLLFARQIQESTSSESDSSTKGENSTLYGMGVCLAFIGAMIAYTFSFTHFPPLVLMGRGTSVHFGATIISGLGVAWLSGWLWSVFPQRRVVVMSVFVVFAGFMVGHGHIIQQDFSVSWNKQQTFWREVLSYSNSAGNETILFVIDEEQSARKRNNRWSREGSLLSEIVRNPVGAYQRYMGNRRYIEPHSWADTYIWGLAVAWDSTRIPSSIPLLYTPRIARLPIMIVEDETFIERIALDSARRELSYKPDNPYYFPTKTVRLQDSNVIVLRIHTTDGFTMQNEQSIRIDSTQHMLRIRKTQPRAIPTNLTRVGKLLVSE